MIKKTNYLSLLSEIELIASKRNDNTRRGLPLQLLDPSLSLLERLLVGEVVNDNSGLSAPIVHGRERMVSLLARRVPDLELHRRVVDLNGLREECRAYGALLELVELAFDEAQDQRRLAH